MSYQKPKVMQEFEIVIQASERTDDGGVSQPALTFLQKVMPDTVHRIAPHIPAGRDIRITISIEGDLA